MPSHSDGSLRSLAPVAPHLPLGFVSIKWQGDIPGSRDGTREMYLIICSSINYLAFQISKTWRDERVEAEHPPVDPLYHFCRGVKLEDVRRLGTRVGGTCDKAGRVCDLILKYCLLYLYLFF